MATFPLLAQLLFLGALVVPAQAEGCPPLGNATEGNFSVRVTPEVYQPNRTYLVAVEDKSSADSKGTQYVLQALSPRNESLGTWLGVSPQNCSSVESVVLDGPQKAANWTSPDTNVSSVQIRAYIITDKSTQFKTATLTRAPENVTTTSPPTTPSSVSAVQSSSLFIAVLQLLLLLATGKLLS